jgi:hypothetical protein
VLNHECNDWQVHPAPQRLKRRTKTHTVSGD